MTRSYRHHYHHYHQVHFQKDIVMLQHAKGGPLHPGKSDVALNYLDFKLYSPYH